MNAEEQIYTLMGMAEEKIKSLDQLSNDLQTAMATQTTAVSDLHKAIIRQHSDQIAAYQEKQNALADEYTESLRAMNNHATTALKLKFLVPFVVTILVAAAITGVATSYYVDSKLDVLDESQAAIAAAEKAKITADQKRADLKKHNAEIKNCRFQGEIYPCVRVKKNGPVFGDGSLYIIEPKE